MQTIIVDMTPGFRMPTIYYSQGDVGTQFAIDLRSRFGDSFPTGTTVTIQATKPSGFGFSVAATSVTNGVATFTTTAEMTDEFGRFPAELKVTKTGLTLFTANFYMDGERNTHPEGTTDGSQETVIPELTQLVERVEDAASSVLDMTVVANTLPAGSDATYSYDEETNTATFGIPKGADGSLASGVLAPTYSSSSTYAVGDYVYYSGSLYRCTTAITTAEAWTSGHWTQVALAPEVSDLKSAINDTLGLPIEIDVGEWIANEYIKLDGSVESYNGWHRTDYVEIPDSVKQIHFKNTRNASQLYNVFYNSSKVMTGNNFETNNATITVPKGAKYFRLSLPSAYVVTADRIVEPLEEKVGSEAFAITQANIDINAERSETIAKTLNLLDNVIKMDGKTIQTVDTAKRIVDGSDTVYAVKVDANATYYETQFVSALGNCWIWGDDLSDYAIGSFISVTGVRTFDASFTTPNDAAYVVYLVPSGGTDYTSSGYIGGVNDYTIWGKGYSKKIANDIYGINDAIENAYVTIGTGGDFATVKDGLAYAVEHGLNAIILSGTYDLVAEGISGRGYTLPKKVYGYGATLLCNLPEEDWTLSPLNVAYDCEGVEVYGLTVICSNCRYCIHDDMGYQTADFYHNVYKDLTLIHNSDPDEILLAPQCIGGGFGLKGYIEIDNCVFIAKMREVSYHSAAGGAHTGDCILKCTNCYFEHLFTSGSIGTSTDHMNISYVSNNSVASAIDIVPQANSKNIAWNNYVRN